MKVKIFTAKSEIEASIIEGALKNENIATWVATGNDSLSLQARNRGPNVLHDIFVEDKDLKRAFEVVSKFNKIR